MQVHEAYVPREFVQYQRPLPGSPGLPGAALHQEWRHARTGARGVERERAAASHSRKTRAGCGLAAQGRPTSRAYDRAASSFDCAAGRPATTTFSRRSIIVSATTAFGRAARGPAAAAGLPALANRPDALLGATNVAPFAAASDASGWPSSQPMPRELILVSIKVIVDLMENSLVHVRSRSSFL